MPRGSKPEVPRCKGFEEDLSGAAAVSTEDYPAGEQGGDGGERPSSLSSASGLPSARFQPLPSSPFPHPPLDTHRRRHESHLLCRLRRIPPPVNSSFFDTSSLVVGAASGDRSAIVEISAPSSRAATRGSSAGTASPSGSTSPPTVRLHPALPLQPAPQPALSALPLPPQGRRDLPPHRQHHHRLQPRHRRSHKFNLHQVLSEGMGKNVLEAMELDANIHVYANDQGDVPATLPTCQAEDGHKENASADETVPMMVYKDERWMVPFEHMEHIRDLKLNTHGTPSNQEDEVEEEMPCDTMRCTKRSNKSAVVAITEECLLLNEEPGSNSQSSEHRSVCLQRLGQMLPLPGWKDLSADLVLHISDSLDLKCYASMRGTCTLWRSALAPPSPSLLVLHDGVSCRPVAASFPMGRLLELKAFPTHLRPRRCIGSSNGWLALSQRFTHQPDCCMFSLFNPTTATEICLPALTYQICWATKLVFTPDPGRHNLAAVVICDSDKIAWVTLGRRWDIFHLVCLGSSDCLTDMVYHDDRMVYCLTQLGDVYVLRLPERGQDAPAMVEPFLCEGHLPFVPVTIFGSTYAKLSDYFRVKNLVFCGRNLYQIWRNSCCRVTLQMPAGGKRSVAKDEILVLMYYPERTGQPCWDAVTELGGYSVFVGRNNAVSRYADDVPGLKGDCVYWISEEGRGKDHGMIFDMATGSSTSVPMAGGILSSSHSTLCWYFLSDMAERGRDIKH